MLQIIIVREDEPTYFILSKFIIIFLIYFIQSLVIKWCYQNQIEELFRIEIYHRFVCISSYFQ